MRQFVGDAMLDFDTTWERLKHNTKYACEAADFFLLAAATSLRLNILIFNTDHPFAHDPIAVISPQQLAQVSPIPYHTSLNLSRV